MIEKKGGPNFLTELEPKFGFGEAFRIYGIERIYGITDVNKNSVKNKKKPFAKGPD